MLASPTTHLTIADHHSHHCTLVPGSTAKKQGRQTPRSISHTHTHTHQLSSTRLNQPNKSAVLKILALLSVIRLTCFWCSIRCRLQHCSAAPRHQAGRPCQCFGRAPLHQSEEQTMGEGTNQIKFCHRLKRNACARDATNTHKKRGAKLDCPAARTCHVDIRAGVSRDGAGDELCILLQLRWDRALVEFGRVAVLE